MQIRYFVIRMVLLAAVIFFYSAHSVSADTSQNAGEPRQEIEAFLNELFRVRSELFTHPNLPLELYYDTGNKAGRHALAIQKNRTTYLNAWAEHRQMAITSSQSRLRIRGITFKGEQVKLTLGHSQKIEYAYRDTPSVKQWFGLGTWHVMTLSKKDNRWLVSKEWFLDPLEENPDKIPPGLLPSPPSPRSVASGQNYDRQRAVAYANKYAGLAWGAGNEGKYNGKYKNYNHLGGDCTNFASQVLGDLKEGGGLKMRDPWRYRYPDGGARTWVQTDALKNFLLHSGYGKRIVTGYYNDLIKPTDKHPYSAMWELASGDLIAHIMNNDVDHFSVVTGFDDHGYPLVNSHTADRYRAPFDLGWDNQTQYLFIHVKD
ncbi:amidase domain-containing protein [Paenibacillus xylanexedens]|uniref:amidase domain-containing protein n=1 Tax=Paenibacillus xylanexedens TaxID=528191 RepID=UPI003CFEB694